MFDRKIPAKILIKSFSFFLTCILLLNTSGHWLLYWAFSHYQYQAHLNQLKEKAYQEEELEILKFAKADLKENSTGLEWLEEKEFRYQGGLYDVVEAKDLKDSVSYKVKRDFEEEEMAKNMKKWGLLSENQPVKENPGMVSWVKLIIQQAKLASPLQDFMQKDGDSFYIPYLREIFHTPHNVEIPPPLASF